MNKKAFEAGLLITSILAVVSILIGFQLVQKYTSAAGEIASREICSQSVQRHADLHIKGFNPPATTINCPPVYMEFEKDKITYEYRESKRSVRMPKDEKKKAEAIKRAMADEIYYCWNQFGEGKKDLFGGPKKYCNICAIMSFKDKGTEVKGFYDYLIKSTVPNEELAKEGVTYFGYMQGYSKKGSYDQNTMAKYKADLEGTELDTAKPYAVVFVYAKSEPMWDNVMEFASKFWESGSGKVAVIGGVALFVGGVVIGFTGVGLPVGGGLMAAGVGLVNTAIVTATIDAGVAAAGEAYLKTEPVRDWTAFTIFAPYDETLLKGLGCEELPLSDKNK